MILDTQLTLTSARVRFWHRQTIVQRFGLNALLFLMGFSLMIFVCIGIDWAIENGWW
jgi:hypothetical protein